MTLTLYSHPLASFCHKVLIALYENATPFTNHLVDLGNPGERAKFLDIWPVGKMPVLRDDDRDATIPETSIIIEYLDQHYFRSAPMFPADPAQRLDTRLWDRFFDLYVQEPLQKIVIDRLRPEGAKDPSGVLEARQRLQTAYRVVDRRMADRTWAIGGQFTLADCAAAPALFYASIVAPFPADHHHLGAYFERLLARPSFRRTLNEARPYFGLFPFKDQMPARFLSDADI